MRMISSVLTVLLLLVPISRLDAQENQFDAWVEAWDVLRPDWRGEDSDRSDALGDEDLEILDSYSSGAIRRPTPREAEAFARLERVAPLLEAAAGGRFFDPANRWEDGFKMLLPHLSMMRQSTRLMNALSRRASAEGDAAASANWSSLMVQTAGQASQDSTLIGSLVAGSIFRVGDAAMESFIGSGLLDQATARRLLEDLTWVGDHEDPLGFTAAIEAESDMMLLEFDRLASSLETGGEDRFLREFALIFDPEEGSLEGLDAANVQALAPLMQDYYDRMASAAADPDRTRGLETMQTIQEEIIAEESAFLADLLSPISTGLLEIRIQIENELDDRLRILQGVASGRIDPASITNAAILWDRLGTYFERLPGVVQVAGLELLGATPSDERIRQLAGTAVGDAAESILPGPTNDTATVDLTELRAHPLPFWRAGVEPEAMMFLELAADAAAVSRAEFPVDNRGVDRLRFQTDELDRLRGAGRGLLADATARLRVAGETSGPDRSEIDVDPDLERGRATTEVVAVLALITDLTQDPAMAHVVLAADLLQGVGRILESDDAMPVLRTTLLRDRLSMALTAVPRPTALGAHQAATADLAIGLDAWSRGDRTGEHRMLLQNILSRRSPDRLHALLMASTGLSVQPDRAGPDGMRPVPFTPWPTTPPGEVGPKTGYRSLKLLASSDGLHGPEWVRVRDQSSELKIRRVLSDLESPPDRRAISNLESGEAFPLSATAVRALDRLAELDRRLRDIGRGSD